MTIPEAIQELRQWPYFSNPARFAQALRMAIAALEIVGAIAEQTGRELRRESEQ